MNFIHRNGQQISLLELVISLKRIVAIKTQTDSKGDDTLCSHRLPIMNDNRSDTCSTTIEEETKSHRNQCKVSFFPQVLVVREKAVEVDACTGNYSSWHNRHEIKAFIANMGVEAKKYQILANKAVPGSAQMSTLVLPFRNCGVYKKMRYLVNIQSVVNEVYGDSPSDEADLQPELRGLEGTIFPERHRNKTIARNAVLEFQRRANALVDVARTVNRSEEEIVMMQRQFAEQLSSICTQLSEWSINESLAAANYDATGVYEIPGHQPEEDLDVVMTNKATEVMGCSSITNQPSLKRKMREL